jgi:UPF0716 protein FxsA
MFLRLLLLLTVVPIIELVLILDVHERVADAFGSPSALLLTVGTIIVTGIIGARLARQQGFRLLTEAQQHLNQGQIPSRQMTEGLLLIIGAATLVTPGYITDVIGILLLLPTTRSGLANLLEGWFQKQIDRGSFRVYHQQQGYHWQGREQAPRHDPDNQVIDVEPLADRSESPNDNHQRSHQPSPPRE